MNWRSRLDAWLVPGAPLLALLGLTLIGWATAREIRIVVDDGDPHIVRTHARTTSAALRQAGVDVAVEDRVAPGLDQSLAGVSRIAIRRARTLMLEIDGSASWLTTPERHPANILASAGYRLLPGDRLWVDGLPVDEPTEMDHVPDRLRLERAVSLRLEQAGRSKVLRAAPTTVAAALAGDGFTLYEGDLVTPGWSEPVQAGETIELSASRPIQVAVGGQPVDARTSASTVGGALAQNGIALVGLDWAEPAIDQPLPESGRVLIHRIREQVQVELEPVPFETTYQPLDDLEIDSKRIIDTGAYGVRANQIRIRYQDGEEIGRIVEGEWLAREPSPRVVGYGTEIVVRSLSTSDGTIEYWRAVQMWATSYSPSRAGVSPDARNFGITASGKPLTKGLVAIDRSLIPFGTRMYVPGYGFAEAADTGSGVIGRWIDLGYDDDNYKGWAQYVTVYFLTPVPPAGSIVWVFP
jgi:uncharacterized protein YabE (DUF348 family)